MDQQLSKLTQATEANLKRRAAQLAGELSDIAEHGVDSLYYRAQGVCAERATRIDALCAEYALLERLSFSKRELSDPKVTAARIPDTEDHDEFKRLWRAIHDEIEEWASRRQFGDVQAQIELIDHLTPEGDWQGIKRALDRILADLDSRAARKYVKRYRAKTRQMIEAIEEAEGS